jgi:hypothetical protein
MSIVSSELIWRKSAVINDTGTNGGIMTSTQSVSGVKNNIFPDVPQAERTSGSDKYRKMFVHVANDSQLTLVAPRVFVETRTPGDDAVVIFAGTQTDTQADISSPQLYGMGVLKNPASGGAGSIVVTVEAWGASPAPIFLNGMTIRISDKADINASGNEEYHVLDAAPTENGNDITLSLTGTLANGFSPGAKVSSVYLPGDVSAGKSAYTKSGSGTHSIAGIALDNIGTIQQNWTLTFSSATNYSVSGNTVGSVGTGTVNGDFAPNNPAFSKPYFTLASTGFGGTFTQNDTIVWTTSPAAIPIWYWRKVPQNAASLSGNSVVVAVDGESS